jgi:hypothetical protein
MNDLTRMAQKEDGFAASLLGQLAGHATELQKSLEGGEAVDKYSLALDLLKEEFAEATEHLLRAQALREGVAVIGL